MQLDTKINNVEMLGEVESCGFTLEKEDVAHIFELLSSSLYSDAVSSCITEICSNSFDAHKEAGKDNVPFELYLPTYFSNVFKCKDFGIGMTKHIFENVYMKIGKSTKRNSNSLIGAYGIGKFASLCVTDTYIIRTSRNGVKLTYNIFRAEDGLPKAVLVNEEPCDETGTEIEFAVDKGKVGDWVKRIAGITTFYPVIPKVFTDGEEMVIEKPKYFLEQTKSWGILEPNSYSRNNLVICGPTSYPIDTYKIKEFITDTKLTELFEIGVHIYVNLGDVAITPNREGLKYNDKTVNLIREKLTQINKYIKEYIENEISGATTYFDAIRKASKLKQNSARLFNCFDIKSITWQGLPLYLESIPFVLSKKIKVKEEQTLPDGTKKEEEKEKDHYFGSYYSFSSNNRHSKRKGSFEVVNRNTVSSLFVHLSYYELQDLEKKIIFVENDINESGRNLDARLVNADGSYLINFSTPQDRADFFEANPVLKLFKTTKISDYEKDKDYLDQFEKNKRTVCLVRRYAPKSYGYKDYEFWADEEIDFKEVEGFYVKYYRNRYAAPNLADNATTSPQNLNIGKLIDNKPIYGLTDAQIKKAEKSGNSKFISLEKYIKNYLKEKYEAYINSYNLNYLKSNIDFEIGNKYEIQSHFESLNELIKELKKNYLNSELSKFEELKSFYCNYIKIYGQNDEYSSKVLDNVENTRNNLYRKKTILETFNVTEFKNLVPCSKIRKIIVDKMLEAV